MTDPKLEQKYRTVEIVPEHEEGNPLILLDTEEGRRTLFDTIIAEEPGEFRWTVARGRDMTYPEYEALTAHVGW